MFKALAALIISLALLTLLVIPFATAAAPVDVYNKVSHSIVQVTGQSDGVATKDFGQPNDYACTGFVVRPKLILTAAHCAGDNMKVDGIDATIIKGDKYYDLMVLSADAGATPLEFKTDDLMDGEQELALGYAYGWPRLAQVRLTVIYSDFAPVLVRPASVWYQGMPLPGMSGGPVIDQQGKVVSMVQEGGDGISRGVGSFLMRAFLLGV